MAASPERRGGGQERRKGPPWAQSHAMVSLGCCQVTLVWTWWLGCSGTCPAQPGWPTWRSPGRGSDINWEGLLQGTWGLWELSVGAELPVWGRCPPGPGSGAAAAKEIKLREKTCARARVRTDFIPPGGALARPRFPEQEPRSRAGAASSHSSAPGAPRLAEVASPSSQLGYKRWRDRFFFLFPWQQPPHPGPSKVGLHEARREGLRPGKYIGSWADLWPLTLIWEVSGAISTARCGWEGEGP